ncbi:MAG: DUF4118 domain-containing protein [Bryobacteraceae bacterium]|nr:DUF4118 domain-containing protein [Bryobacteraceae bacterium]
MAILAFAVALAVRAAMMPVFELSVPYITFFPAVMFSAWYGGLGPGLIVTGLSAIASQFFFHQPVFSLAISSLSDVVALLLFIAISVFICLLNHRSMRSARQAEANLRLANERLDQLCQESAEREQAERREADARRWALDVLSSVGDALICTDLDSRVTFLNPVAEKMTGWPLEEATGKPVSEVFVILNEGTRKPAINPVRRILQEGIVIGLANHTILRSRSGEEIPIDDSGAPIRNRERQIMGAVLVFRDMSERKSMEDALRQTAQRLARSNEDLGSYAHTISHDLQEPLRAMSTFSELLCRRYQGRLDADADTYLTYINESAVRMSQMVRDLLTFSRTIDLGGTMAPVRLADAVNWAERNLEERIRNARAVIRCDDLPSIVADHVQLVQLFQNLLDNALKYRSAEPPEIHIKAFSNDNHWRVSVTDNGIGIDASSQEEIFRLFRRANTAVPGSGVGLAICKRIVERHDGEIWVESVLGQGSTFNFTLAKQPARRYHPPRLERQRSAEA